MNGSSASPSGVGGARPARRVVISSLTGKPLDWDGAEEPERSAPSRPVLPDRVEAEAPEPGADESNDARLTEDVPPHWGGGA
ncbi:hypothetical protein [Brachybacterium saurashtrense]|uniref:Uncharacterized protein n=1 Tax=Brachybacterium saurashtrense TaxID=556288 RepID=A0A345YPK2_9MICO|nr:hypothetical protein [Brachybacterium saurashtrense]AXK45854.1 hypothetical protein DWV08_09685 [Brachybacterium saurashtrense]RRR24873.1 hypothetical protein DXU92_01430 [Brachybacterium saurashtrense]